MTRQDLIEFLTSSGHSCTLSELTKAGNAGAPSAAVTVKFSTQDTHVEIQPSERVTCSRTTTEQGYQLRRFVDDEDSYCDVLLGELTQDTSIDFKYADGVLSATISVRDDLLEHSAAVNMLSDRLMSAASLIEAYDRARAVKSHSLEMSDYYDDVFLIRRLNTSNDFIKSLIPEFTDTFLTLLSDKPFPSHTIKLTKVGQSDGQAYYRLEGAENGWIAPYDFSDYTKKDGWRAPALFKNRDALPEHLYLSFHEESDDEYVHNAAQLINACLKSGRI
ncbi:MAG: hypothetical protein ABSE64_16010 [Vulcanimicrobiaceae bacterium]